jgi:fumarate reductase flavoprotein subunit
MIAALGARSAGADPLVVERDPVPGGSTALSAGLIPAAGTAFQARQGIRDDVERFRADVLAKSAGLSDRTVTDAATAAVGPALEWLHRRYDFPFDVITDFMYPGHSAARMHALPRRTGAELIDRLRTALEAEGITLLTSSTVSELHVDDDRLIRGVAIERGKDGSTEHIGCRVLVLACSGYGGNKAMLRRFLPAFAEAPWFGHSGNVGDAVQWGEALGAALRDMSGHQGHGSVAVPHGILVTWATMTEGGFQVNTEGRRFSDESRGYSEQGEIVLRQPGGVAWSVFDRRIAVIARQFEDFRNAEAAGAIIESTDTRALAAAMQVDAAALAETFAEVAAANDGTVVDRFGRRFAGLTPLQAPFCAVRVTGALFHTQGGLVVDSSARVLAIDGSPLPNLYAAGGAAVGASGPSAAGYLSGNGLLTAVGLGFLAGASAARQSLTG